MEVPIETCLHKRAVRSIFNSIAADKQVRARKEWAALEPEDLPRLITQENDKGWVGMIVKNAARGFLENGPQDPPKHKEHLGLELK
jgi:hypothetical protein